MPGITLKNGLVSYYGNPAGYTEKDCAVVDNLFKTNELASWLASHSLRVTWTDGVMERLKAGEQVGGVENATPLKNVRIWQLKPESDIRLKFMGLDMIAKDFGTPDPANYCVVYDGQLGTNDLEAIYERCNINHPSGYNGHSLSISDVVELYHANTNGVGMGSEYHYCDQFGFKSIDFTSGQTEDMGISMSHSF